MYTYSPLPEIGMNYALSYAHNLSEENYRILFQALDSFIKNSISLEECSRIFQEIIKTKKPVTKIDAILQIPNTPISNFINYVHKNHHWSEYEDRRLLAGIHRFGLNNWSTIAAFVGNSRTKNQCFQRWTRGLNPQIRHERWTPEEEKKLQQLVESSKDPKWSTIATQLGNRSDVQCRYHYKLMISQKLAEETQSHIRISESLPVEIRYNSNIEDSSKSRTMLPSISELCNYSKSDGQMPSLTNFFSDSI